MTLLTINELLRQVRPDLFIPEDADTFLASWASGPNSHVACWRADFVERRGGSAIDGEGLFIKGTDGVVTKGTLLAIKPGHILSNIEVKALAPILKGSQAQISPAEFIGGKTPAEVAANLVGYNHSCDPNASVYIIPGVPLVFLIARRDIKAGEEVTVHYSVAHNSETQRLFVCKCGSPNCRGMIHPGFDWMDPVLQEQFAGEFPWHTQLLIDTFNGLSGDGLVGATDAMNFRRSAAGITALTNTFPEVLSGKSQGRNPFKKRSRSGLIKDMGEQLIKGARLFVSTYHVDGQLETLGVKADDDTTIIAHIPEIVELARAIDRVYN